MAKILQFDNRSIFADIAQEVATLRLPVTAGTDKTLTLDNNSELVNADFVLVEDVATGRAEIAAINQAVTAGTTIRVDTLKFPHAVGVKIYRLKYNQIKFYRAATVAGSKTQLGSTTALDVDDEFTEYVDTVNSTGYAFFTLFNSATSAESDYSSAYPYSLLKLSAKSKIREFVRKFYKSDLDEDLFDMLANTVEDEVFSLYPYHFREATFTFNTEADEADYSFSDLGLTDFGILAGATYNGDPIGFVTYKENQVLNWGALVASNVLVMHIWENSIKFTPAPSAVNPVVLEYWKNAPGFSQETTDTLVSMPQVIAFGILQDLWSMEDTKKSQYWENRKLQTIAAIKRRDEHQVVRFAPLGDSSMSRRSPNDQFTNPSIG